MMLGDTKTGLRGPEIEWPACALTLPQTSSWEATMRSGPWKPHIAKFLHLMCCALCGRDMLSFRSVLALQVRLTAQSSKLVLADLTRSIAGNFDLESDEVLKLARVYQPVAILVKLAQEHIRLLVSEPPAHDGGHSRAEFIPIQVAVAVIVEFGVHCGDFVREPLWRHVDKLQCHAGKDRNEMPNTTVSQTAESVPYTERAPCIRRGLPFSPSWWRLPQSTSLRSTCWRSRSPSTCQGPVSASPSAPLPTSWPALVESETAESQDSRA